MIVADFRGFDFMEPLLARCDKLTISWRVAYFISSTTAELFSKDNFNHYHSKIKENRILIHFSQLHGT